MPRKPKYREVDDWKDIVEAARAASPDPEPGVPDLAHFIGEPHNVTSLRVSCLQCRRLQGHDYRQKIIPIDRFDLNETIPDLEAKGYCAECREAGRPDREIQIMPDWPPYQGNNKS